MNNNTSAKIKSARLANPTIVKGAVGPTLSNNHPPILATKRMPIAPKKLKPPMTAPRPFAGAALPINDIAEIFAKISPRPKSAAPNYIWGLKISSIKPI